MAPGGLLVWMALGGLSSLAVIHRRLRGAAHRFRVPRVAQQQAAESGKLQRAAAVQSIG